MSKPFAITSLLTGIFLIIVSITICLKMLERVTQPSTWLYVCVVLAVCSPAMLGAKLVFCVITKRCPTCYQKTKTLSLLGGEE